MKKHTLCFAALLMLILAPMASSAAIAKDDQQSNDEQITLAVQKRFAATYRDICNSLEKDDGSSLVKPWVSNLEFRYDYEEKDAPTTNLKLFIFSCFTGAYNFGSVFFTYDEYEEIKQLQFAVPEYDVDYLDDDFEKVRGISLRGFSATDTLFNIDFDPETYSMNSFSKWRGVADASSSGNWEFENGIFVLKSYDVDASYDSEINPIRIYGEGEPEKF